MKTIPTFVLCGALLQGCAGVNTKSSVPYIAGSKMKLLVSIDKNPGLDIPEEQFNQIKAQIEQRLTQGGRLARKGDENYHSATVTITSFRMRPDAARLLVGAMAGCDNIKSNVSVVERDSGKELGSAEISIEECAAWGVADQVIGKYSDGVADYLTQGKK